MQKIQLIRDVGRNECPWLQRDFNEGEELCIGEQFHYGCISPNGIGCAELSDPKGPMFEIPKDALNIARLLREIYNRNTSDSNPSEWGYPEVTVIKDISALDYSNALKDFSVGVTLYFYPDFDLKRTPGDCIPVTENIGDKLYFELPNQFLRTILG